MYPQDQFSKIYKDNLFTKKFGNSDNYYELLDNNLKFIANCADKMMTNTNSATVVLNRMAYGAAGHFLGITKKCANYDLTAIKKDAVDAINTNSKHMIELNKLVSNNITESYKDFSAIACKNIDLYFDSEKN